MCVQTVHTFSSLGSLKGDTAAVNAELNLKGNKGTISIKKQAVLEVVPTQGEKMTFDTAR